MNSLDVVRERLDASADLPAILETAYTCFTAMLTEIQRQQDPSNPLFVPFVMAGASAASGRFALAAAPSLPLSVRTVESSPGEEEANAGDIVLLLGQLAELLNHRLRDAAVTGTDAADRQACADAARHAAELSARFGRTPQS